MRYLLTLTVCLFTGLSFAEEKLDPPLLPVETELLKQINAERARFGLPAMILHPRLQIQARRHAAWMANSQSMVHSADPQPENISMRPSLPEAVRGWMNSSGHRANILNASYVTTGAAGYVNPNGSVYWCQQFSSSADPAETQPHGTQGSSSGSGGRGLRGRR
jgi:uncharacterized protein YkwD